MIYYTDSLSQNPSISFININEINYINWNWYYISRNTMNISKKKYIIDNVYKLNVICQTIKLTTISECLIPIIMDYII